MKFYLFKTNPENQYKKEDAIMVIGEPDITYAENTNKMTRCPQPEFYIYNPSEYIIIRESQFNLAVFETQDDVDTLKVHMGGAIGPDLSHHVIGLKYLKKNDENK